MKLSVVIPIHNEQGCIRETIINLYKELTQEQIEHEIVAVNDNSRDNTEDILNKLSCDINTLRLIHNSPPNGFGFAVRKGLEVFTGDAVAIYMADASDSPKDLIHFYRIMLKEKVDCVFGTRWSQGGYVVDYPMHKRIINRLANYFIQTVMQIAYNDVTNAFKLYKKDVIKGIQPLLSYHFNLTVELPLKAIVRGYSYTIIANSWTNRASGVSKLKIREMGSRYLFIVLYCLIEKWLSRHDYHRSKNPYAT